MPIDDQADFIELIRHPEKLREAMNLLRKLETLKVQVRDSVGTITISPLLLSRENAIIDLTFAEASAPPAPPPDPNALDPETITWRDTALVAGGTFGANSIAIANGLIKQIKTKSYNSKIKYLLPLLGSNLATARVPLRDALGKGIATNNNVDEADYSEATGLQGNGTDEYLDTKYKASEIGFSNSGGMGLRCLAPATVGAWGMGARDSGTGQLFGLAAYSDELFYWGDGDSATRSLAAAGVAGYYGQRTSITERTLWKNGLILATDAAVPNPSEIGIAASNIVVLGIAPADLSNIRIGCAYLTDGTLTSAEIADLHAVLTTYLITPTGR